MAFYLSPLVDVNEIDLSTTIPAVATSVAVSVLRMAWKGPEYPKQQLSTTIDELVETFGEPTATGYEDLLSSMGYLKYGNKLYSTRAMPTSASFAGSYGTATSAATFTAFTTENAYIMSNFDSSDPDEYATEEAFDAAPVTGSTISMIANSRGVWGNYTQVALVGRTKYDQVTTAASYADCNITQGLYNDILSADKPISDDSEFLVIVKTATQDALTTYNVKESFLVSTQERRIDDEGNNIYCETTINNSSQYIRMAIDASLKEQDVTDMMQTDYIQFAGGQNMAWTDDDDEDSVVLTAYQSYQNADEIDVNIFIDSNKSTTIKSGLVTICEARKDAMAVLDCLKATVVNNVGSEATGLRTYARTTLNENTSYAALYGNWLNVFDKWNGIYRWIPASGHVAGIMANTDDVSDPWFAPAGLNRSILNSVRKLAWNPTQGQRDILYKSAVNPIVAFAGQGKVIWGQKTLLDKNSAFNRINVRRLFMVLEKAISTSAKYFLFEPNDAFTRLQLINMIEPFLRDVRSRRGIYDFMVVCDSRNNTAERVDRNELWCDLYIKPVRAAEYIVLNFIATATGASFTELIPTAG